MVALPGGSGGARTPTDAFRMRARAAAERQRSHVRPSARRSSLHPRAARDHRCSGSRVGTRLAPRSARGGTQGWKNSTTYRVHRAQPGGSTARQARGGDAVPKPLATTRHVPREFVISSTPRGRIVSADAGARRRERMRRPRESRKTCEASSAAGEAESSTSRLALPDIRSPGKPGRSGPAARRPQLQARAGSARHQKQKDESAMVRKRGFAGRHRFVDPGSCSTGGYLAADRRRSAGHPLPRRTPRGGITAPPPPFPPWSTRTVKARRMGTYRRHRSCQEL